MNTAVRKPITITTLSILCWLGSAGLSLANPAEEFEALLQEHWSRVEQEQVFFRTDPDAFRPDGKLPEMSAQARARRQAFNEDILGRLEAIEESQLEGQDRISFKVFRYERETERDS